MWDTWLFYKDGTHYLYYLHMEKGHQWDGISLALSKDGVHYEEVGPVIRKRDDAQWLGTGSVWEVDSRSDREGPEEVRYVMNFSEQRDGVQAIFFAYSHDLIHWERLDDSLVSRPDPQWYDDTDTGRWDCIWTLPKPSGGFYGYLTARPWNKTPGRTFESVGMVESDDGLRWKAVPPPQIEWDEWPQMNVGEVGAIEKIGNKYYLLLGYSERALGERQLYDEISPATAMVNGKYRSKGMYTFVAEQPEGPFRPDKQAYRLLVSNGTYFARFYRFQDELLVNHHSFEPDGDEGVVWMAPLKRAALNSEGSLDLYYWQGNEKVKGTEKPIDLSQARFIDLFLNSGVGKRPDRSILHSDAHPWRITNDRIEAEDPYNGGIILLEETFEPAHGIVLEGSFCVTPPEGRWGGIGFYLELDSPRQTGSGIMMQTCDRTEIAAMLDNERGFFDPLYRFGHGITAGKMHDFRILLRSAMIELYIDDKLILCYSFPSKPTGQIGLIFESGKATFENITSWRMI